MPSPSSGMLGRALIRLDGTNSRRIIRSVASENNPIVFKSSTMSSHHARGQFDGDSGHKRRREDAGRTPHHYLLESLIFLGDDKLPSLVPDETAVTAVVNSVKRELRSNQDATIGALLDCILNLPNKVPLYALLVGMLNVEEPAAVDMLLAKVATTFASALEQNADYLRVSLRFLAALVPVNVLNASAVMALLASIIQQAVANSKRGEKYISSESPSLWQPYVDFLVHVVLTAIPFGGADLIESSRNEVEALAAAAKTYADSRPIKSLKSMRPFACSFKEGDVLAECDFGACTFVATAVKAFKEYLEAENWQLETIPHVHGAFLSSLAAAEARDLPPMNIPSFSTLVPDDMNLEMKIVAVQDKFPIRGELPLLEPQHTQGDRILLERLYVEDYILDTLANFESDRVECAKRLASGLPVPYAYEPLLCQTIFGQMLLFRSRFKPQMYGSLMIDLCKLQKTFPRAMSACVRECFARMSVLDPCLRVRLADWLAFHQSSFDFVWPWPKWQHVLTAPLHDPQRRFCMLLIERLSRLSYWDKIQAVLPEEFCALLPPKPEVQPLEGSWAPQIVDKIRSKASAQELSDFLDEMETEVGGQEVLRHFVQALLYVGSKSYTHLSVAIERYYGPLEARAGTENGQLLLDIVSQSCSNSSLRGALSIERFVTMRFVTPKDIVAWCFDNLWSSSRSILAHDMLFLALSRASSRVKDTAEEDAENYASETRDLKDALQTCFHKCDEAIHARWVEFELLQSQDDENAAKQSYHQQVFLACIRSYMREIAACWGDLRDINGDLLEVTKSTFWLN